MKRFWAMTMVGAIGAAVVACDSTGADKDAVAEHVKSINAAVCDYIFKCCDDKEVEAFKKTFTSKQVCLLRLNTLAERQILSLQERIGAGGIAVRGGALAACLAIWKGVQCGKATIGTTGSMTLPRDLSMDDRQKCDAIKLYEGLLGTGGKCYSSTECPSDHSCLSSSISTRFGICVPRRDGARPCNSTSECKEGLVCTNGLTAPRLCARPAHKGEDCTEKACDIKGDPELRCKTDPKDPKKRTCEGRKGAGGECSTSLDCKTQHFCKIDVTGGTTTRKCVAQVADGEKCDSSSECTSGNCKSDPTKTPPERTCAPGTTSTGKCDGK